MADTYMFYDDETANSRQKICSLGFEITDRDGVVSDSYYTLVDPEDEFQEINISIHGIDSRAVEGAPRFDEVYRERLREPLSSLVVVGHNLATADLYHIRKSLAAYGIEMPEVRFIDTLYMPGMPYGIADYRLETICRYFGIWQGNHHNALADAKACEAVFWQIARKSGVPEPTVWVPKDKRRSGSRPW